MNDATESGPFTRMRALRCFTSDVSGPRPPALGRSATRPGGGGGVSVVYRRAAAQRVAGVLYADVRQACRLAPATRAAAWAAPAAVAAVAAAAMAGKVLARKMKTTSRAADDVRAAAALADGAAPLIKKNPPRPNATTPHAPVQLGRGVANDGGGGRSSPSKKSRRHHRRTKGILGATTRNGPGESTSAEISTKLETLYKGNWRGWGGVGSARLGGARPVPAVRLRELRKDGRGREPHADVGLVDVVVALDLAPLQDLRLHLGARRCERATRRRILSAVQH